MGAERSVPWFPAWGVRFADPIANVFSMVSLINEWRNSNRWLLLAFDAAASEIHLWTAWYKLRTNENDGCMVAKTPETEFLRLISGTNQINRAFERAGISKGDKKAWIVMLPSLKIGEGFGDFSIPIDCYNDSFEDASKLIEHLGGSLVAKRPTPTSKGLKRIGFFSEISMDISQMEKAYLSHMALSDVR